MPQNPSSDSTAGKDFFANYDPAVLPDLLLIIDIFI